MTTLINKTPFTTNNYPQEINFELGTAAQYPSGTSSAIVQMGDVTLRDTVLTLLVDQAGPYLPTSFYVNSATQFNLLTVFNNNYISAGGLAGSINPVLRITETEFVSAFNNNNIHFSGGGSNGIDLGEFLPPTSGIQLVGDSNTILFEDQTGSVINLGTGPIFGPKPMATTFNHTNVDLTGASTKNDIKVQGDSNYVKTGTLSSNNHIFLMGNGNIANIHSTSDMVHMCGESGTVKLAGNSNTIDFCNDAGVGTVWTVNVTNSNASDNIITVDQSGSNVYDGLTLTYSGSRSIINYSNDLLTKITNEGGFLQSAGFTINFGTMLDGEGPAQTVWESGVTGSGEAFQTALQKAGVASAIAAQHDIVAYATSSDSNTYLLAVDYIAQGNTAVYNVEVELVGQAGGQAAIDGIVINA